MSYILEALKKSDRERQQRAGPVLARAEHQKFFFGQERPGRWWQAALVVAALALVVGVSYLAYRGGYVRLELPAAVTPAGNARPQAVMPAPSGAAAALAPQPAQSAAQTPGQPAQPAQPAQPPAEPVIPELWQLPLSTRAAIPALDFSLHVYSESPEQRSIIINNRMMREGEYVDAQLQLIAITRQGVIMRFGAETFRVGILEDW